MFSIGEFARLAQVPVKTLRYYDEIGLFIPDDVDRVTGYRRYSTAQIGPLNRILALKALGFRLDEIRRLITEPVRPAELRGMLLLRRSQVENDLTEAKSRIREIESRLHHLEKENQVPAAILTKIVPPMTFAGSRALVADHEPMRKRCIALDRQTRQTITRLGLQPNGPSCALYYPHQSAIDVEMGYPVRADTVQQDDRAVHVLDQTEVAYAIYTGSYDDFAAVSQLHLALRQWVSDRQVTSASPVREHYLQPSAGDDGIMELQYPLR